MYHVHFVKCAYLQIEHLFIIIYEILQIIDQIKFDIGKQDYVKHCVRVWKRLWIFFINNITCNVNSYLKREILLFDLLLSMWSFVMNNFVFFFFIMMKEVMVQPCLKQCSFSLVYKNDGVCFCPLWVDT